MINNFFVQYLFCFLFVVYLTIRPWLAASSGQYEAQVTSGYEAGLDCAPLYKLYIWSVLDHEPSCNQDWGWRWRVRGPVCTASSTGNIITTTGYPSPVTEASSLGLPGIWITRNMSGSHHCERCTFWNHFRLNKTFFCSSLSTYSSTVLKLKVQ